MIAALLMVALLLAAAGLAVSVSAARPKSKGPSQIALLQAAIVCCILATAIAVHQLHMVNL